MHHTFFYRSTSPQVLQAQTRTYGLQNFSHAEKWKKPNTIHKGVRGCIVVSSNPPAAITIFFSSAEPDTCRIGVSLLLQGWQHTGGKEKKAKGGFRKLKKKNKKKNYILHSSFLFFQTTPSTVTLSNQQGKPPSTVPKNLAKCKIKSSLSVGCFVFFFF